MSWYVIITQLKSIGYCLRDLILNCLPNDWLTAKFLRPWILRIMGAKIGSGSQVSRALFCGSLKNIQIGRNVFINRQVFFDALGKIVIEDNVVVGFQAAFVTGNHEIGPFGRRCGKLVAKDIIIGPGAWIAARAFIGPGVEIGEGSVVAAGAVVIRSMPANCMIGGVPAKVIKQLE